MSSCDSRSSPISPIAPSDQSNTDANINFGNPSFNFHPFGFGQFSVKWSGNISIAVSGNYAFQLVSDDGSWLMINSTLIIDHGGLHSSTDPPGTAMQFLSQGVQQIEVDFYETCGGPSGVDFSWMPPGSTSFVIVPPNVFSPSGDFSISASSPGPVNPTIYSNSTISVASLSGFTNSVSLVDIVPPGLGCGPITPSSIGSNGTALLSCTSSMSGSFSVKVTGTSGSLSHSATATFSFNGWSISIGPNSITISPGGMTVVGLYLTSVGGFTGTVQNSASEPTGINLRFFYPTAMTLSGTVPPNPVCWAPPNACNNALYVGADSTTPHGTYTVIVTGSWGPTSHQAQLIVNV